MKKLAFLSILMMIAVLVKAQAPMTDAERAFRKDSTLKAAIYADSVKIEKQFAEQEKFDHLFARLTYPTLKEAKFSGVLPVTKVTEVPDPNQQYKLLFEVVKSNPDSMPPDVNGSLAEVARIINLHIASGIPIKNIQPVIVVHGSALDALTTAEAYKKKHDADNPNFKLLDELRAVGTKFIACGQAMQFFDVPAETLAPDVKISLTAQTVLSNYQLKGYVLYKVEPF